MLQPFFYISLCVSGLCFILILYFIYILFYVFLLCQFINCSETCKEQFVLFWLDRNRFCYRSVLGIWSNLVRGVTSVVQLWSSCTLWSQEPWRGWLACGLDLHGSRAPWFVSLFFHKLPQKELIKFLSSPLSEKTHNKFSLFGLALCDELSWCCG